MLTVCYDYERSELKYDQCINDKRSELYRERAQRAVSSTCMYRGRAKRVVRNNKRKNTNTKHGHTLGRITLYLFHPHTHAPLRLTCARSCK